MLPPEFYVIYSMSRWLSSVNCTEHTAKELTQKTDAVAKYFQYCQILCFPLYGLLLISIAYGKMN